MKFELATIAAKPNAKINIRSGETVFVGIAQGIFVINFTRGTMDFFPELKLETVVLDIASDVNIGNVIEYEFSEQDLKPKDGFPGVKSYRGPTIKVYDGENWRRLVVEYFDTTKVKIPSYKHNVGKQEAYIYMDDLFEANVYSCREAHEHFTQHFIMVKLI